MVLIPWNDLSNAAYGAGTALGDMVRGAGQYWCDMARNYPGWFFQNPLGINPIARGINDRLCQGNPPLPPPDQPALPGGKCFCVSYRVEYTVAPDNAPPRTEAFTTLGPITVIGWVRSPNVANAYNYVIVRSNASCTGTENENLVAQISQAAINNGYRVTVNNITRVGGGADNCGGQVPRYAPIQPPANVLERPININIAPNVGILIPVAIVRPSIDLTLSPNVDINLQPQFNFGDIGISLGFSLGGVNINNNFSFPGGNNFTFPSDPRPNPPTLPPGQDVDDNLTELYRRLRDVTERLRRIEECACDTPTVLTPQTLGSGNSGTFALPQKTKFVVLRLDTIPGNSKGQAGLNAPNVLYAGWAWYRLALNSLAEREPVDASVKYYEPPPTASAFCYTLYGGFSGTVIAYRET